MNPESSARPPVGSFGPLDRARLTSGHPELMPDLHVEVVAETGSTNDDAARRAQDGAPDGLVVVAEHQTAGHGRLGRVWETPAGSAVTFSLVVHPEAPARAWPWIPLLTGYAISKALRAHGVEAGVKWPNDVLIDERKVAGILVERVDTRDGAAAVIGVGINVGLTSEQLPVPTATSLAIEGGPTDRTDVLVDCLNALREAFDAWDAGGELGGTRLRESFASACLTVGRAVRVEMPDGTTLAGTAVDIDPDGQLLVEADGSRHAVSAGDVVHVR